jgi:hypothetical protein
VVCLLKHSILVTDNDDDNGGLVISDRDDDGGLVISDSDDDDIQILAIKSPTPASSVIVISDEEEDEVEQFSFSESKRIRLETKDDDECASIFRERFFQGNKEIPYFDEQYKKYSTQEVVLAILNATPSVICSSQPYGCEKNCSFIIDLSKLHDVSDVRSDDLGSWRNVGVHTTFVDVIFLDGLKASKVNLLGNRKPDNMTSTNYKLKKSYWKHKSSPDYSRRLFELNDFKGNQHNLCLVQYQFDNEEHCIEVKPHGNSKNDVRAYTRTKASVNKRIKLEALQNKPNEVFNAMQGDVIEVQSCGSVPRNRQQISNARKLIKAHDEKDTLLFLLLWRNVR